MSSFSYSSPLPTCARAMAGAETYSAAVFFPCLLLFLTPFSVRPLPLYFPAGSVDADRNDMVSNGKVLPFLFFPWSWKTTSPFFFSLFFTRRVRIRRRTSPSFFSLFPFFLEGGFYFSGDGWSMETRDDISSPFSALQGTLVVPFLFFTFQHVSNSEIGISIASSFLDFNY